MRTDYVLGLSAHGFHKIHYTDWGDPASERVVICVHGLTRNGRDFDFLARALADECRVVCPDVAGRGRSDWLDHKDDYNYQQYTADMNALMAAVTVGPAPSGSGARSIYWVGTSMGGMIGMLFAALPHSPIRKLVVSDVGPLIPKAALERIATYVGKDPRYPTFEDLEAYVRQVSAPFGPLTQAQWRHLTLHGAKQHADGSWGMCYDPGIAVALRKSSGQDVNLWSYWDTISCPTLALRGADSDLLLKETAEQMQKRGPRARLIEFAGVGHAPMLIAEDQIKAVKDFLLVPE